jgi:anaphase-promoting complex subunit 8
MSFQKNPSVFREHVHRELRRATVEAGQRGLKQSCAWAADLLQTVSSNVMETSNENAPDPSSANNQQGSRGGGANVQPTFASRTSDAYLLAKSYFDMAEYKRAAYALRECTDSSDDRLGCFLRLYSLYLAGEKRKEEELMETKDALQRCQVVNRELNALVKNLEDACEGPGGAAKGATDGYFLHIFGSVLKKLGRKEKARDVLCRAVQHAPWNWSAWLDLASVSMDAEIFDELENSLPEHVMKRFFMGHVLRELQQHSEALDIFDTLEHIFPNSKHVLAEKALTLYHMRDFDESEELFEQLNGHDPHRLETMDTYSNILYVKEDRAALSLLAHRAMENNKYCPETCCIVGNYYSLKHHHEKAVLYFRRALKLDPDYLSAWTLMGHEYVEMKNTAAAIEAYRRAVDINPRDYRAWYGLGQTYEMLGMQYYALHYYRKAATLRPYDSRMWTALGNCFDLLERTDCAIDCYQRADRHGDREGIAAQKLGSLHHKNGDDEEAARYYEKFLNTQGDDGNGVMMANAGGGGGNGDGLAETLLFLARYHKDRQAYDVAENYCRRLLDLPSTSEKNEAKAMLRELKSRRGAGDGQQRQRSTS